MFISKSNTYTGEGAEKHRKPLIRTVACFRHHPSSNVHKVINMTGNPPDEGIPAPAPVDYSKIIDELKAANVALVEKVNALEEKSKGFDQKITALSGEAAKANAAKKDEIETKKKEFDEAYDRAMEFLGFRIKKE